MSRKKDRARKIAVLDLETDPFDGQSTIRPFACELYAPELGDPIVIWNEDFDGFVAECLSAIESLPGRYIIYAHNGGRFDWLFFVHKLSGRVMFRGNALMSAKIGRHEIRDSMHIIPEGLSGYEKKKFDYRLLQKSKRNAARKEILEYLHSDCVYLYEIVSHFVEQFGPVLTVGIASLRAIKKVCPFTRLGAGLDGLIRPWYLGGRVECLKGGGRWKGSFKLYDVNSMYPRVMSEFTHPLGPPSSVGKTIREDTFFVHLRCENRGAFLQRNNGEFMLTPDVRRGEFFVTIHEYNMAIKHDLISNVEIIRALGFDETGNFSAFVVPHYAVRQELKETIRKEPENRRAKRDALTIKYLLNSGYGKFGQDPANNMEYFIAGYEDAAPSREDGWQSYLQHRDMQDAARNYEIFRRPSPGGSYNNVATAASITGAARAVLLDGLMHAVDPVYCDTDSIIARGLMMDLHPTRLGAWDIECEISEIIVAGKKLYGYRDVNGKEKVRCKGGELTWRQLENILSRRPVKHLRRAPTIDKAGQQRYIERAISMTVSLGKAGELSKEIDRRKRRRK